MSSFISLLFFLLLNLRFGPTGTAAMRPDIIKPTCKASAKSSPNVNYTLCVSSLSSVPRSHKATLQGLSLISVKLAAASATQARRTVKKLLKAKPKDKYTKSCLQTCLDLYKDAVYQLKTSINAIKSGRYDDANIMISSAVDAPGSCEDGFNDGEISSPLAKEDHDLFQQSVIALAITALLG